MKNKILWMVGLSFCVFAQEGWAETSVALNPKMSVIMDLLAQSGTTGDPSQTGDGVFLREVEIGLQADIDPYARADVFVGGMDGRGGSPEVEEGYVTIPALPGGFQLRGGKFRAAFGRLNLVHPHEYPQADAPLVLPAFLGEEGLTSVGVEISKLFTPGGHYGEATYALLQDVGAEKSADPATTRVVDVNGSTVSVAVASADAAAPQRGRRFAHVAKVRFYQDVTDAVNVDLGVSGALWEPLGADQRRMAAVDMTWRWKPPVEGLYRSLLWRTEGFYSDRHLVETVDPVTLVPDQPAARVHARGAYSSLEIQSGQRWRWGLRSDYAEDPEARDRNVPHVTRAWSPFLTVVLTEFHRIRFQYQRKEGPGNERENLGFLQWTVVMGPHGGHPF